MDVATRLASATAHRSLSRSILLETHGELLHKAMLINILMAPPTRVLAVIRRVTDVANDSLSLEPILFVGGALHTAWINSPAIAATGVANHSLLLEPFVIVGGALHSSSTLRRLPL
eukprot:scaffold34518_cov244-Skeletonema_dohrnii-CCMP3373.AAC.1